MKITDNEENTEVNKSSLVRHVKKLTARRISLLLVVSFFLFSFGALSFFYGAYMYYTGRYYHIRMLGYRIIQGDFSFVINMIKSSSYTEIDRFDFDIKFKDMEKLRYLREQAVKADYLTNELQQEIPAEINYNGTKYKVTISLTGQINEHFRHPEKWSVAVKVKGDKTIYGMKEFALLVPMARGYMTDWIAHKMLEKRNSIGIRCDFIDVNINGKSHGIYYLEERYNKHLLESNRFREGIIFKVVDNELKVYNEKKIRKDPSYEKILDHLYLLWNRFLNGDIESSQIFDLNKLAATAAVSDLMNQKHPLYFSNIRFYFNPITFLIEPIAREWGVLTKESRMPFESLLPEDPYSPKASLYHRGLAEDQLVRKILYNDNFFELYMKEAEIISQKEFLDSILAANEKEYRDLMMKLYNENPFYEFPLNILYRNQMLIRNKLFPLKSSIVAIYKIEDPENIIISIKNLEEFPVEVHSVAIGSEYKKHFKERLIINPKHISGKEYYELRISIPKDKSDEFSDKFELVLDYSILGIGRLRTIKAESRGKAEEDVFSLIPTKKFSNLKDFYFLDVNENKKEINFIAGKHEIKKDLIIPEGYAVSADPGLIIDLLNGSKIITYSPVYFHGKKDNNIELISTDSTGQGLVVLNCDKFSEISYTNFRSLSNISDKGYVLPSAVCFYESPVNISNCNFYNNLRGDDYLNIFRTNFTMTNCGFFNTFADAFDGDFCEGAVESTNFYSTGNDAIDVSGSRISLKNIHIKNSCDKGLSSGEKSEMKVVGIKIEDSEIAVCSKDKSTIEIDDVTILNSEIGFTAYQKKPEFGSASIIASNVKMTEVTNHYLVETESELIIDGVKIVSDINRVKDLMYGVIYGKSSK